MNTINSIKAQTNLKSFWHLHGFQYYDNVLRFFHTPEGCVKNTPDDNVTPSFDYVYQYKDHLGNIRVSYTQDTMDGSLSILNENHYYSRSPKCPHPRWQSLMTLSFYNFY